MRTQTKIGNIHYVLLTVLNVTHAGPHLIFTTPSQGWPFPEKTPLVNLALNPSETGTQHCLATHFPFPSWFTSPLLKDYVTCLSSRADISPLLPLLSTNDHLHRQMAPLPLPDLHRLSQCPSSYFQANHPPALGFLRYSRTYPCNIPSLACMSLFLRVQSQWHINIFCFLLSLKKKKIPFDLKALYSNKLFLLN